MDRYYAAVRTQVERFHGNLPIPPSGESMRKPSAP